MIITSICCWTIIILGIILLIYGLIRDMKHRRMYRMIEAESNFKSHFGFLTPSLTGNLGVYKVRFRIDQRLFIGPAPWQKKIFIIHPNKLFPNELNLYDSKVFEAYSNLKPQNVEIKRNKILIVSVDGLTDSKDEILALIHNSILLAKTVDCSS